MFSLQSALSTVGCFWLLICSGQAASSSTKDKKRLGSHKKVVPKGKALPTGALAKQDQLRTKTFDKLEQSKRLNRREKKEVASAELATYKEKRREGVDEVSNTEDAVMLRNYRLRNKKRKGLIRKKEVSLSQILFPGVSPEEYVAGEQVWIYADLVESKKTQVPYEFYD
jgi:hypothetical protein